MRQGTLNQGLGRGQSLALSLQTVTLRSESKAEKQNPVNQVNPVKPERPFISMLYDCDRFSLDMVFIAREQARYRLVVLQKGKFIKKDYYPTLKGARQGFNKTFVKGCKRLKWSEFFKPKQDFLNTLYYSIGTKKFIAILLSAQYLLDTAFIMAVEEGYRLIVNHKKVSMANDVFRSFDQARAAFLVRFKNRTKKDVEPIWSEFYPPGKRWLDKHLKIARGF